MLSTSWKMQIELSINDVLESHFSHFFTHKYLFSEHRIENQQPEATTHRLLACSSTIDTINVFVFFEESKWNVRISLLVFKQLPICSRLEQRHKQSSVFNKSILSTLSIPCSCRSFTDNTSFSARNYLSPFCAAEHECFVLSRRNFKRHEQRQDKWAENKVFQFTCENIQYFPNLLLNTRR